MKTVLVDLDGVLADYRCGFQGIDRIGEPIPGAVEFVAHLRRFARVVIFTTRCKAYPPGEPVPNGLAEVDRSDPVALAAVVRAWLDRHGFDYDEVYTGQGKPLAACIIDDRAVCCRPQAPEASQRDEADPSAFTQALWAAETFCSCE